MKEHRQRGQKISIPRYVWTRGAAEPFWTDYGPSYATSFEIFNQARAGENCNCTHRKLLVSGKNTGRAVRDTLENGPMHALISALHDPFDNPSSEFLYYVPSQNDIDTFNGVAFESMSNMFKIDTMNVAVQLAELTELGATLKPIIGSLKRVRKSLPRIMRLIKEYYKRRGNGSFRKKILNDFTIAEVTTALAGTNLWYSFGVAPLVSLAKEGGEKMIKLAEGVQAILDKEGQLVTRHFSQFNQYQPREVTLDSGPDYRWYVKQQTSPVKLTATMAFTYRFDTIKVLGKDITASLAMLEAMGFSRGKTVIWNMIPLSFLVDWICNLGDILTSKDFNLVNTNIDVHNYQISWSCNVYQEGHAFGSVSGDHPAIAYLINEYQRTVCAPNLTGGVPSLTWRNADLNWSQIAISASLLTNFTIR